MEGKAKVTLARSSSNYILFKKDFGLLCFFFQKLKESCSRELFLFVTFDLTRQANLAIKRLNPKLVSNGELHDWQTIKDIQATLSLIVQPAIVFDGLHGLSLRALN